MKNKVTWPTYKELQESSILVLIASMIFALLIGAMGYGIQRDIEGLVLQSILKNLLD